MKKSIYIILLICILIVTGCSNKSNNEKLPHGKLIDFKVNCKKYDENDTNKCLENIAIIKVKIESSYSNKATIDQNYYNVEKIIKDNNVDKYQEIQYWAVADMKNGEESKVISFTLDEDTIKNIYNNKIVANKIGDYATDLYILPSLKQ